MAVHREVRTSATESMYGLFGVAVVKPGKLYVVQAQIGQCFGTARMSWRVERLSPRVI